MAKSDYSYYPKLWQKSILIEIVRRDTGVLYRSFAFSLPPESIQVEIPQRVNITKTFGGVFIDDYGIDTANIQIAGSTGNGQLKEIYANGISEFVTGQSEAYYVIEQILQYKRNTPNYEKYELRYYDLSSITSDIVNPGQPGNWNVDGWVVVLKEGKITRAKDKPFFYNYSLSFIGIEPIGTSHYQLQGGYAAPAMEQIFGAINNIKNYASGLKKLLSSYKSIIDKIKLVEEATNSLEAGVREYYKATQGFVSTTIDGVNSVFDTISFPFDLTEDLLAAGRDLRDGIEAGYTEISAGFTDLLSKPQNNADMFNALFGIEDGIATTRAASKSIGALPEVTIVPENAPGAIAAVNATDPNEPLTVGVLLTYGYYDIVATSETRLDALSNQVYGTPDYADTIAAYNGITGDSEITPGMSIKIPYLAYTDSLRANEIYDQNQNAFGTDILLDSTGDLTLAEYNDYATIAGVDNVGQAIQLRTSEQQGARVRLDVYGIKQLGGGFDAFSIAVLVTSIRETLLQDPRIKTVQGFTFQSVGDTLEIAFDIELEVGGTARFTINL